MPFPKNLLRARLPIANPSIEPCVDKILMGLEQIIGAVLKESGQIRLLNAFTHKNRPFAARSRASKLPFD